MQRIVVLGSAAALSTADRDNTFLVFDSPRALLLLDCAGSPYQKLLKAGLDPKRLEGAIITHAHPDHIYGLPSLIHHFMMAGREEPFTIYANARTLRIAKGILGILGLKRDFVAFSEIPMEESFAVLDNEEYAIHTSPVRHIGPTLAVKITAKLGGLSVVYSADTAPCPELLALAKEADILFHECSTPKPARGHSTPWQVGKLAQWCDVKKLVLVHLHPSLAANPQRVIEEVREYYKGEVEIAQDFEVYELSLPQPAGG